MSDLPSSLCGKTTEERASLRKAGLNALVPRSLPGACSVPSAFKSSVAFCRKPVGESGNTVEGVVSTHRTLAFRGCTALSYLPIIFSTVEESALLSAFYVVYDSLSSPLLGGGWGWVLRKPPFGFAQ